MNWKEKMDAVVKDVLGIEYTCVVNTDKSFTIYENNVVFATRQSSSYLESHWRIELKDVLAITFRERMQAIMQKY
jgi:hypothetical protein